jgi:hypothetical protein
MSLNFDPNSNLSLVRRFHFEKIVKKNYIVEISLYPVFGKVTVTSV